MDKTNPIATSVLAGERISATQAEILFQHSSLDELQALATAVKARYHDPKCATYLVMAIINYTNVCVANCDFCAFFRFPYQAGGYLLTTPQLCEKINRFLDLDVDLIAFNGGFNPQLKIKNYEQLFAELHARYDQRLTFFAMTVAEFMFACKISKLSYHQGAEVMRAAGVKWITGGGAEVLVDSFRQRHSKGKYSVADYYHAQQAILTSGIASTATMVIGFDETLAERIAHLEQLRNFQDSQDTQMPSFLCWTYKPENNRLGGEEINTDEYLRWLAICRIYLDNFKHIRTSVLTKNEDALRGLAFGADDFDIPLADEVTEMAGATIEADYQRILAQARQLGFQPTLRSAFANVAATAHKNRQVREHAPTLGAADA